MSFKPTIEELKSLENPTGTTDEMILNIVQSYLNADAEYFEIKELTNDQVYKTDDLLPEGIIAHGVMQIKNIGLGQTLEGTIIKQATFTLLLPLNESNKVYMNAIEKAILKLSRAMFEDTNARIIFDSIQFIDANRLAEPIDGVEYELVYIEASIRCSRTLMMATEQHIEINDKALVGVISIVYGTLKTTDPVVSLDPIQKNTTNGIQVSLTVDLELDKNDPIHKQLCSEADKDINYNVKYYNGYSVEPKVYVMKIINFASNAITGDSIKVQIVFMVGDS